MQSILVNALLSLTILLWSSAYVGIRIGLTAFTPGSLALFRFLVASLFMIIIYPILTIKKPMFWSHRIRLILLGAIGIGIYNIALNMGELTVSAGVASFIVGLMPILTLILSLLFLNERANQRMYLGIAISLAGLVLMAWAENANASVMYGMLIILLSALTGAVFTVMLKQYLALYHPVAVAAWAMWGGMLSLLFFAPALWREIHVASFTANAAAVYLGIFPAALGYIAWGYVLNFMPVSRAALFLYTLPLVSTLIGFVLLHEEPTLLSLSGGFIALIGALLASTLREKPVMALPIHGDKELARG
ncbi:DMT family transporter [Legionella impletisoli]|uniref:Transporter YdfC n=1 Tax=Legionella impletisoli TaxID=343510 RepID=A0A917NBN5_9GAMM|nr:DMT family transporter [Legionella impletisoli]GGI86259.1 putative transporter YdfC [Legionella impletisoli]